MPSLRQRMSTYFRQLSFIADPKETNDRTTTQGSGCFITKYLEGKMGDFPFHLDILHGKEPTDLPDMILRPYDTGPSTITAACTGPDDGLTIIKRARLHLSAGPDIDFIDDIDVRTTTTTTKDATNKKSIRSRKSSKGSINECKNISMDGESNSNSYAKKSTTTTTTMTKQPQYKVSRTKKLSNRNVDSNENNMVQSMENTINCASKVDCCENIVEASNAAEASSSNANTIIIDNMNIVDNATCSSSHGNQYETSLNGSKDQSDCIINSVDWNKEDDHACGIAVSLYEKNAISNERAGNPIADCYGLIVRGDAAVMALADGVNWGEGARLAARSAVLGSLDYINTAVFGQLPGGMAISTCEVFVSLLRSFWEGHNCILEVNGALSTLTIAIILPLGGNYIGKYVVCACNVGDSLGYVYSAKNGVKEFTQGSHDITSMRDMRDALGALGPVHDNKPELSNLTLSLTIVEPGDIVFLTSDGVSDNFDPVVGKFVEPFSTEAIKLAATTASGGSSAKATIRQHEKSSTATSQPQKSSMKSTTSTSKVLTTSNQSNQMSQQQQQSTSAGKLKASTSKSFAENKSSPLRNNITNATSNGLRRQKFIRSNTVIDPRVTSSSSSSSSSKAAPSIHIPKSISGLPLVTAQQRQTLTLLRIEDLLSFGINSTMQKSCKTAKNVCHTLMNFATMITSARRKILEQRELFYRLTTDHGTGMKREMELTKLQQRAARKRIVDSTMFTSLPGKLDHASIVAYTVGANLRAAAKRQTKTFEETDF